MYLATQNAPIHRLNQTKTPTHLQVVENEHLQTERAHSSSERLVEASTQQEVLKYDGNGAKGSEVLLHFVDEFDSGRST